MSQSGYTPVQHYRSTTPGEAPVAGNLLPGELAINIADGDMAVYAENASGVVKRLINNPAGLKYPTADGTAGQVVKTDASGTLSFGSVQAVITGAATTIDTENLTVSRALVSDGSGKVAVSDVTATELGYVDGVTSAIQTQLNAKQNTITGAATTIDTEDLTVSRALVSDGSGKVAVSAVTATELGYVDGVTSAIQTQLNDKVALTGDQTITGEKTLTGTLIAQDGVSVTIAEKDAIDDPSLYPDGLSSMVISDGYDKGWPHDFCSVLTFIDVGSKGDWQRRIRQLIFSKSGESPPYYRTSNDEHTAWEDFIPFVVGVGNQTITGVKTFSSSPIVPNGDATGEAVNFGQLSTKQNTITGAATTIDTENLTVSRALVSDGSGKVAVSAVTATELGYVDGVTSAIQTQLNAKQAALVSGTNIKTVGGTSLLGSGDVAVGPFPAGTTMLFVQTSAPTGWTKVTTHNNKALRVVSGTAGSGGTTAFTSVFASRTPTGSVGTTGSTTPAATGPTTLTVAQLATHNHSWSYYYGGGSTFDGLDTDGYAHHLSSNSTTSTGSSSSHTHGSAPHSHGGGTFTGNAMNFAVQYVDVILAIKN